MRRVQVTERFEHSVYVRDVPLPKAEQLTASDAEEGLLPQEPLRAGERVLLAGAVELKAVLQDLETRSAKNLAEPGSTAKARPVVELLSTPKKTPKLNKG
jgi:cobalt-zinc-cadmium efflux system membrane fusion protein